MVILKGAQLGVTEYDISLSLWLTQTYGAAVIFALPPGKDVAGRFTHSRLDPAIDLTPSIGRAHADADNVGLKIFARGQIFILGTHIPEGDARKAAQLASIPADAVIFDEIDRIPSAAIPLLHDRLLDSRLKIERINSTPTFPSFGVAKAYATTDMREPFITCPSCSRGQFLYWGMVHEPGEIRCDLCNASLNIKERWDAKKIKFVKKNKYSEITGYWLPGILSHRADLSNMIRRSHSSDEEEVQAFWNNGLGLPYEPKGSKLTEDTIADCARDYTFAATAHGAQAAMGVDVQGPDLAVYIKAKVAENRHHALWIGNVPEFEDLDELMDRYDVKCCVVDGQPETRKAREFAEKHRGRVWLARFVPQVEGARIAAFHEASRAAGVDRTKAILTGHSRLEQQVDELPKDWRFIPGFLEQMTANIRIRTTNAMGQVVYKFKASKPDHFDLAKAYCEVAMERVPVIGTSLSEIGQMPHESRWVVRVDGVAAKAVVVSGGHVSRWRPGR